MFLLVYKLFIKNKEVSPSEGYTQAKKCFLINKFLN